MVFEQSHIGTAVGMAGLDSATVQIGFMAVLVFGAAILALFGSFTVLVVVPLAAVVVRKRHAKRTRPSVAPEETEGPVPLSSVGPRHASSVRDS